MRFLLVFNSFQEARNALGDIRDNYWPQDRRKWMPRYSAVRARKHPKLRRKLMQGHRFYQPGTEENQMPRMHIWKYPIANRFFIKLDERVARWAHHKGYQVRRKHPQAWLDYIAENDVSPERVFPPQGE